MTDTPKRPRGRPRKPGAPTATERTAAVRTARGRASVELPQAVADALDARASRYGVRGRVAVVEHLLTLTEPAR